MNRRSFLVRAGAAVAALVGVRAAASTPSPVTMGVDLASGPDRAVAVLYGGARGGGKTDTLFAMYDLVTPAKPLFPPHHFNCRCAKIKEDGWDAEYRGVLKGLPEPLRRELLEGAWKS